MGGLYTFGKSSILLKYFVFVNNHKIEMTNEVRELFELASGDMSSLYNYGSRAASTVEDTRETEIADGLILSKRTTTKNEPVVINLQEYAKSMAKAASTPAAVNEVRELFNLHFG